LSQATIHSYVRHPRIETTLNGRGFVEFIEIAFANDDLLVSGCFDLFNQFR